MAKGKKEYDMMIKETEGEAGIQKMVITAFTPEAEKDLQEESDRIKKLLERVK